MHERFAGSICGDWRCRWKSLHAQLEEHRRTAAAARDQLDAELFPVTVVPFRRRPFVPVRDAEREELHAFLQVLAQDLSSRAPTGDAVQQDESLDAEVPVADSDDVRALLGKVCGVCQGFCCHHGASRQAFLDDETLLHFMQQHPGVTIDEAVKSFVDRIPAEHVEDSCLYHTETGCNLPRDVRARICNTYECKGLTQAREHCAKTGAARAFVVIRHDNRIMGSQFVDACPVPRQTS